MRDHKDRAAKTIQRWFKSKIEERLLKEAESAVFQTKNLHKMNKNRLISNHILGRESVSINDPYAIWREDD